MDITKPTVDTQAKGEELTLELLDKHHAEYTKTLGTQTGVGIGRNSGVLRSLFDGLQKTGFSLPFILSKLFILMDFLQQYSGDITKIIEAFSKLFAKPATDVVAPPK